MKKHTDNNSERGVATIEFALTVAFFFMMLVADLAGGHLYWTHNALVEATRRGARYAANQCKPNLSGCPNSATTIERVRNVVLYRKSTPGTTPIVPGLLPSNVTVVASNDFGVAAGTISVKIENYNHNFFGVSIPMPPYQTTAMGENAGYIP